MARTTKVTEKLIQQTLIPALMKKAHNFVMPNVYFFDWEADLISVSKSGMINEFEIKLSTSDFNADFKKRKKHDDLDARVSQSKKGIPNYFWYVCPKNLISLDDLPHYAGLIWIVDGRPETQKRAPQIHNKPISQKQIWRMGKSQMWRLWELAYAPRGWKVPKRVQRKRRRRNK